MKVKIVSRYDKNKILFECEAESTRQALIEFVAEKSDLSGADLYGVNIYGVNLYGVNLYGADLRGADLSGANLRIADLSRADLSRADLSGADLSGADLSDTDLRGADLRGADISGADIIHAGARSDGHRFYAHMRDGVLWVKAGCRYFTIADARKYWRERRGGTQLGDESQALLDHAERMAKIRGWIK